MRNWKVRPMRNSIIIAITAWMSLCIILSGCGSFIDKVFERGYWELRTALIQLDDPHPAVRAKAAYRLAEVGTWDDEEMLSALTKLAETDESDSVRIAAFNTLLRFSYDRVGIWETAMDMMQDDNPEVRAVACYVAAVFAPADYAVEAYFPIWLNDPDPMVRKYVLNGIVAHYFVRERPDYITQVFIDKLSDEDPDVRADVARYLTQRDVAPEKVADALLGLLDDSFNRITAVTHLANLDPPPLEAVPYLLGIFYDRPPVPDMEALAKGIDSASELERVIGEKYPDSYLYGLITRLKPDSIEVMKDKHNKPATVYLHWSDGRKEPLSGWDMESNLPAYAIKSAVEISRGPEVMTALMVALYDEDPFVRRMAILAAKGQHDETAAMLPRLIEMARTDQDMDVKTAAISALGVFAEQAPDVIVPLLINALDDRTSSRAAAQALRDAGGAAADAVPALSAMLVREKAEYDYDSSYYASALIEIELASGKGLPFLVELQNHENDKVRDAAADALAKFGEDAIPYLLECFDDPSSSVIWSAAEALGKIARENPSAIPYMVDALKDEDALVVREAVQYFEYSDDPPEEIIPLLIGILDEVNPATALVERPGINLYDRWSLLSMASSTVDTLADFGPAASEAVPSLTRLLSTEDSGLLRAVFDALGEIGAASVKALPELRIALNAKSVDERAKAAHVIGVIGPDAEDAAGDLMKLLADENPGVRREAATSLGLIGLDDADVLSALGDTARNDGNIVVREAASRAIEALSG